MPARHPYVQHLRPVCEPRPAAPPGPPGQPWRPAPAWDTDWLDAHADQIDVVHVHFGFEHLTVSALHAFTRRLRRHRIALVLTVHDLQNPHLRDQQPQQRALDVLIAEADAVLTLTPGAAAEIHRRWGRLAQVAPHPHLVGLDRLARPRPAHDGFVVALHTTARANCGSQHVQQELDEAVASLPGGRLQQRPDRYLSDAELWDHLSALDVLVLPYAFGSHSGFVEACFDLGTVVLAARTGYLHQQHPVLRYDLHRRGSLTAALRRAYHERPRWRADPAARARQREQLAATHDQVYRAAHAQAGR